MCAIDSPSKTSSELSVGTTVQSVSIVFVKKGDVIIVEYTWV